MRRGREAPVHIGIDRRALERFSRRSLRGIASWVSAPMMAGWEWEGPRHLAKEWKRKSHLSRLGAPSRHIQCRNILSSDEYSFTFLTLLISNWTYGLHKSRAYCLIGVRQVEKKQGSSRSRRDLRGSFETLQQREFMNQAPMNNQPTGTILKN